MTAPGDSERVTPDLAPDDRDVDARAVITIAMLAADAVLAADTALAVDTVQSVGSGRPGLPMGAAAPAYVLWSRFLRHDPACPDWPDRDRFVLSAGHGSMLLYSLLHLFGYDMPMAELKAFRRWGSGTPGHPERGNPPGVETTTGPLGQGLGNAVGMALAERMLAARYNRPGQPTLVGHRTYVLASAGDLMEGLSHEAASLAGHLGLGRLIVVFDDNHVSIDGDTSLACSDDVPARFASYGWHVRSVDDGHDLTAIDAALRAAVAEEDRPSLIAVRARPDYAPPVRPDASAVPGTPLSAAAAPETPLGVAAPETRPETAAAPGIPLSTAAAPGTPLGAATPESSPGSGAEPGTAAVSGTTPGTVMSGTPLGAAAAPGRPLAQPAGVGRPAEPGAAAPSGTRAAGTPVGTVTPISAVAASRTPFGTAAAGSTPLATVTPIGAAAATGTPPVDDELARAADALARTRDELSRIKERFGWPTGRDFHVPEDVGRRLRELAAVGTAARRDWESRLAAVRAADEPLAREWDRIQAGMLPDDLGAALDAALAEFARGTSVATRTASGQVLRSLAQVAPELVGGAADLTGSTCTDIGEGAVTRGDFRGRNIHFGVREHAMGAVLNGMALHGGLRPFGGTFLVFSDYMRPAIRLAALMRLPVTYVFTHDSVAVGEDGPTHQPVEHLASLRAIPGLAVIRPADANETARAWELALSRADGPTALILSRQPLPVLPPPEPSLMRAGARVVRDGGTGIGPNAAPDVALVATGSEVSLALEAADLLRRDGVAARVVSVPWRERFLSCDRMEEILPPAVPRVAIEAGSPEPWWALAGEHGDVIGLHAFGASGPGPVVAARLGFAPELVRVVVRDVLTAASESLPSSPSRPHLPHALPIQCRHRRGVAALVRS